MKADATPRRHLAELLRLVEGRAGLVLRETRWAELEGVVDELTKRSGVRTPWEYVEKVRDDPAAFEALLVRLVIGETYFFREAAQIRELRERVIPALGQRKQGTLRVWSAGCASGEEAYTLSILFQEAGLGDRTEILGTDLSPKAVEFATAGVYRPWSFRGVEPSVIARYFHADGERFRVGDEVRRRVRFAQHNLVADSFPPAPFGRGSVDLILCRNVLFYFTRDRARDIGERFLGSLSAGAMLVIGPSDPMLRCDAPNEAVVTPGGLFYRRGGAAPQVPRREARNALAPSEIASLDDGVSPPSSSPAWSQDRERSTSASQPAAVLVSLSLPLAEPRGAAESLRALASLRSVEEAFGSGDYESAAALARAQPSAEAAVWVVRALSNSRGTRAAVDECELLRDKFPFHAELAYLHATLLLDVGHVGEAYEAARRIVYLDRTLEMGHFLMATIAMRRGDVAAAERALRHAHRVASSRAPSEVVPLGDGELAGSVARTALEWLSRCKVTS